MSPKSKEGDSTAEVISSEHEFDKTNVVSQESMEVKVEAEDGKVDLDDALDQTGQGTYTYVVLFVSCFSLLSVSTEAWGIGLIVTSAQCELDLDTYRKGIIGAVPMLGILVSSHAWGYIADTRGRRYAMVIALTGAWVLGLASSFATHWIALAVLKFFSVIFASGGNAVVYAFLVELTPRSLRNRYMMLASTALQLSQSLIATLGYLTLRQDFNIPLEALGLTYQPWRLLCQVFALVNVLGMLMFIVCVYESPKFYFSQGRDEEGLEVLRRMYSINTGKAPETYPVKSISMHEDTNNNRDVSLLRSMWNQTAPLFHRKYIRKTLIVMYIAAVVFSTAPPLVIWLPHIVNAFLRAPAGLNEDTFCDRVVSQLERAHNASTSLGVCNDRVDDLVLYTMMTLSGFIVSIGVISTVLVKWLGKRCMVIFLNAAGAVGCMVLDHVYGYYALVVFLTICSNSMIMGVLPAFAVEIYPTYLRSMAVCLTIMAGRGFSFIVINIMGTQVENNCGYFFYAYGAFIMSAALAGFFLPGEQKKKQPKSS